MRILIIDDEKEICFLLKRTFEKNGDHVDTAHTIKEGKDLAAKPYEAVILDINLPDGNGIDAIPELKEHQQNARFVMISAYNLPNEIRRAKDLGADAFIGKPFSMPEISALVYNQWY